MRRRVLLLLGVLALAFPPGSLVGQGGGDARPGAGAALTLPDAVALALATHPAVGQARAQREMASAGLAQARSALLPTLSSQGSLARFQEPMVVAPLHGFDPMHPPEFDRSLVQGSLALSYTLFDGGTRSARIESARAGEEAAGIGVGRWAMEVTLQVSAAYLAVLTGQELLEAARRQSEALEAERRRVEQFLGEGKAARVDLLRVEAAVSRAEAARISARTGLEVARGRLARLTGSAPEEIEGRGLAPLALSDAPLPSLGRAVAAAASESPEVSMARQDVAGAAAEARGARAAWFPRVEAGGQLQSYGTTGGGHVQEWQATVRVSYPLFTGGARGGEVERAAARERHSGEALRLAELGVADQVEEALAALAEAGSMRVALEHAVGQSQEVARIEALALEAGAGVQTDFLRAQAELFQARGSLAQARHGEVLARVRLARVMGELTETWIRNNLEGVR